VVAVNRQRSTVQRAKDFATFPIRAFLMFGGRDRFGLSALATERFEYVTREVDGYCLDIGCGRHNRLVTEFLGGEGVGIDLYPYEGLDERHLVEDMTNLPFSDGSFDAVTFNANFNHIPEPLRDREVAEAYRCLRPGGRVIVTMGNPVAEVLVHKVQALYDRALGTNFDVDSERGMEEGEAYYVLDREIRRRLAQAGFGGARKRRFTSQWGLNHLIVARKPTEPGGREVAPRPLGEDRPGTRLGPGSDT